jgi:hypothetical protein
VARTLRDPVPLVDSSLLVSQDADLLVDHFVATVSAAVHPHDSDRQHTSRP